jgi:hypothetical protein
VKRLRRNLVESKAPTGRRRLEGRVGFAGAADRYTAKQRAVADELRHHHPFGRPELLLVHETMLRRLRAA